MIRIFASSLLAIVAVVTVSARAGAEETIIEKRTYEEQRHSVEIVPAAPTTKERIVEEHTVTKEQPAVQKRTDTVVTTTTDDDNDNDNDNDND